MTVTALEISDLLVSINGLPKPQWAAIANRIEASVGPNERFAAWTGVARQWLGALCIALGQGYETAESEHFLVILPPSDPREVVLAFAEKCRRMLFDILPGIAASSAPGKDVVLLFRDRATCDGYLSLWFPSNRFLGGAQLRGQYPHVAATGIDYNHLEATLAHELTHLSLCHLDAPLWLEEGLAQMLSQDATGLGALQMTPRASRQQRRYWKRHGLAAFWAGYGFVRADDDQCGMCYELAEVLVRLLVADHRHRWFGLQRRDQQRLCAFVREADRLDGGEVAAREHLGYGLADLAAKFLGPGNWTPRGIVHLVDTLGYPHDAISFVLDAILGSDSVNTRAVGEALRAHAVACFGKDARDVLRTWRVVRSEDVGTIVGGLVGEGLLITEEGDSLEDFAGQFDIDELFAEDNR